MKNVKKDIAKDLRKRLAVLIVWSVLAPVSVVAIVLSAINSIFWLMGISIAFAALCFYGLPIGWTAYGQAVADRSVAYAVLNDKIYDTEGIARNVGLKPSQVIDRLRALIAKRYLPGFVFSKDEKTLIPPVSAKAGRCPGCGAPISSDYEFCSFCGHPLK